MSFIWFIVIEKIKKFLFLNILVKEKKWVFEGSAGWLLFWLIVAPPVGYIWLILDMEKK